MKWHPPLAAWGRAVASGLQKTVQNIHFRNPQTCASEPGGSFTSCNETQTRDMMMLEKNIYLGEGTDGVLDLWGLCPAPPRASGRTPLAVRLGPTFS